MTDFAFSTFNRKIENENLPTLPIQPSADTNVIAANAITGKLNEVSKIAESLDTALRETQNYLEMDARTNSLDRKNDGNASIDSRGSIDVIYQPNHYPDNF